MRACAMPGTSPDRPPIRVLVAGCGTGAEAYAIASAFPRAQVVGIDFSARSIAIARSCSKSGAAAPQFAEADLCDPTLPQQAILRKRFDFISCQGVASYVPDVDAALSNLRKLLTPKGMLYLGVNGAGHHSVRIRPLFRALGMDPTAMSDERSEATGRDVLRMYEILTRRREGELSDESPSYIANDVFGPINRCLPLGDWLALAGKAGLEYRGNLGTARFAGALLRPELLASLLGLKRAEVAAFFDGMISDVFHSLVLTPGEAKKKKERAGEPDFADATALMPWRPLVTLWDRTELEGVTPVERPVAISLTIPGVLRRATLECRFEIVEILRLADGKRSLAEIYKSSPLLAAARVESAIPSLFGLYHSNALQFLPPASR